MTKMGKPDLGASASKERLAAQIQSIPRLTLWMRELIDQAELYCQDSGSLPRLAMFVEVRQLRLDGFPSCQ
jgi:hypothetical protein